MTRRPQASRPAPWIGPLGLMAYAIVVVGVVAAIWFGWVLLASMAPEVVR